MRKKQVFRQKIISLVAAACILVNLFPVFIVTESSKKVSAQGYIFDTSGFTQYDVGADPDTYPYASIQTAINAILLSASEQESGKGRIVLHADISENIEVPDDTELEIDLNGQTLSPAGEGARSNILVYGKLKLSDSQGGGKMQSDGVSDVSGVEVINGGTFVFAGGTIRDYYSSQNGAGIIVEDNAFMSFNGGNIENCVSGLTGGGVYVYTSQNAEFVSGTVSGCKAENGGGIAVYRVPLNGEILLENMTLTENEADELGGGVYIDYPVKLSLANVSLNKNKAQNGGGIYFGDVTELNIDSQTTVNENSASQKGGGIYFNTATTFTQGSKLDIDGATLNNNSAVNHGGAVYFREATIKSGRHTVNINNAEFTGNSSTWGGALYIYDKADVAITGTHIDNNSAVRYGGGLYIYGGQTGDNRSTLEIEDTTLSNNKITATNTNDRRGGGFYAGTRVLVKLKSGEINNNSGACYGGGLYTNDYSELEIFDGMKVNSNSCYIENGSTGGSGMYLSRTKFVMTGGEINYNTTVNYGSGGGITSSYGSLEITGGEIAHNRVKGSGVGIYASSTSYFEISGDALITDNKCTGSNEMGGGIYCNSCTLELSGNAVISNNENYSGGGIGMYYCNIEIRENAQIINNKARNLGGGLWLQYYQSNRCITMKGGKINNNTAGSGGGIYVESSNRDAVSPSHFTGGEVCGNTATNNGGGINFCRIGWNNSETPARAVPGTTFEFSTDFLVENNTANNGGGIFVGGGVRAEVYAGAKITGNTAKASGGGMYVSEYAVYYRNYVSATQYTTDAQGNKTYEPRDETLTIYGGELHDNSALNGRDLYISEVQQNTQYYKKPYVNVIKASSMDGASSTAYWIDENREENIYTALSNRDKINNNLTPNNSRYTFNDIEGGCAKINTTIYHTVQAAVDAIQNGTAPQGDIILLKSHRETVVIPTGVTAVLDLNGLALYGEAKSVITVEEGAALTLKDSSEQNTGKIADGKGTVYNNNGRWGGGALVFGTLNTENVRFTANSSPNGSAIAVIGGSLNISGGLIDGNRYDASTLTVRAENASVNVTGLTMKDNQARGFYLKNVTDGHITDTEIFGHSGSYIHAVGVYGTSTVYVENCSFHDNTATSSLGTVYAEGSGAQLYVKDTVIRKNTSSLGAGIYNNSGHIHLDNVTVTENYSTGDGGGMYCNNSGHVYVKNTRIYNNLAASYGFDVRFDQNGYFHNESDDGTDHRIVENLGMADYNGWYDEMKSIYYVQDKTAHSVQGAEFGNTVGDMIFPDNDNNRNRIQNATKYLTAVLTPDTAEPVAEIIDTGNIYSSLDSAFKAALLRDDPVEIKLLKDVSERININKIGADITLDFNGHTVSAVYGTNRTFYIKGATVTFTDRTHVGEGGLRGIPLTEDNDILKLPRGIYLEGGKLTIENIVISDFRYRDHGGAIYSASGFRQNNVNYASELYIREGTTFRNNIALNKEENDKNGGAIYFNSTINDASGYPCVFEMTGGTFINNKAYRGGAVYFYCVSRNDGCNISITGGLFEENEGKYYGGAIFYDGNTSTLDTDQVTLYGFTMRGNISDYGGAIYGQRLTNNNYPVALGDADKKTVFDGNIARVSYAAAFIGNEYGVVKGIDMQNIEIKNNYCYGSVTFHVNVQNIHAHNIEVYNNYTYSSDCGITLSAGELLAEDIVAHDNSARTNWCGIGIGNPNGNNMNGTKLVRNCESYNNICNNGAGFGCSVTRDITLENINVHDNYARDTGAVCISGDGVRTVTLLNCHFHDNTAQSNGGGMYIYSINSTTRFVGTVIENNISYGSGGGIYSGDWRYSNLLIEDGTIIRNNVSTGVGGAINSAGNNIDITGGEICGNKSKESSGGGIYFSHNGRTCHLYMSGGDIHDNIAGSEKGTPSGGGIAMEGYGKEDSYYVQLNLSGGKIRNNRAYNGGGLIVSGGNNTLLPIEVRITGTEITDNYAKNAGGGILFSHYASGDAEISGSALITRNKAGSAGGGFYIDYARTDVKLLGGKLFGNNASTGNDAFINYHSGSRNSNLYLYKASEMFGAGDEYLGLGWIDERTSAVYTDIVKVRPLGKTYPYTLSYRRANKITAVYNGVEYNSVTEALEALEASESRSGEIILVDDSVESITIGSGLNVTLNLNGHTLKGGGTSTITNRGTLTISDDKRTVTVGDNTYPEVTTTGKITGTSTIAGGGVMVKSGKVTMTGGSISDCVAGGNNSSNSYGGAAVAIDGGEFVLRGGSLSNNVARNGSAVLVRSPSAVFTMYGGSITGNHTLETGDSKTDGYGAGVYNRGGKVNIYGGTISNNTACMGGAVYNNSGDTDIIGPSIAGGPVIEDNIGGNRGGGVYINSGRLTTSNCTIQNNKTTYARHSSVYSWDYLAQGAGGGIYSYAGALNITDGTVIKGNTAVRGGALYQINGTVLIRGANTLITENRAQLGGGCAQTPLPGNSTTVMTLTDEASVYGNKSTLTAAGNDFYSAWEGTNTYEQQLGKNANYTPRLNLLAAVDMSVSDDIINVWKNDNYTGTSRTGTDLISGQFVVAEINYGRDIQITSAYYNTDVGSLIDSNFAVINLSVAEIKDGTDPFDDGQVHDNIRFDDAGAVEKSARQLLDEGEAELTDDIYHSGGFVYRYIRYNGKLYEQDQIVEWQPGNDSSISNKVVRSYDDITYSLSYSVVSDPPLEVYTRDYNTRLRIRAVLHCEPEQASFNMTSLSNAGVVSGRDENDQPIQILTGYWNKVITPKIMGEGTQSETQQENIVLNVYSMPNGGQIKPEFEMWFEGNDTSPHDSTTAETVTVSAAPKYNISVMSNPDLCHLGYFNMENMTEVGEGEYEENPDEIVNGVVMGFGVTLQIYNDPAIKKMKGIELPSEDLEFDLSFTGKLYNSSQQVVNNAADAPIIWAYKENSDNIYGRTIDSSVDIVKMQWDDEDKKTKHSFYAHGAAPYNSGGGEQSCYDGGGWLITRSDKPTVGKETKLHVKVSGYKINNDVYPTKYSGNVTSAQLASNSVKAFSAGYIQMILPFNKLDEEHKKAGYYQIYMDAVASNLDITSITGQNPDTVISSSNLSTPELVEADISGMNEYYGFEDPFEVKNQGYAVNERRYYDNYANIAQAIVISSGGDGNNISKSNIFDDANNHPINGTGTNDNGKGETPLNSTVFIRGGVYFHSATIDTGDENSPYYALNDPLYNTDGFNVLEYNYLTAINILQKFDASAYTVTGTVPIIREKSGNALNQKLAGNFIISSDETETTWSNTVTKSYELTILYGAKPDGSNWSEIHYTDTSVSPPIEYTDGGAHDMDLHKEENLLYFESLEDLHIALGSNAKCVAILYQFRNCVIRSDYSISASAKASVTGDFTMVGDTYCTTNDVRTWYTYRPYYKIYFADKTVEQHTYQFNWLDTQRNPDAQTTDPELDDYEPAVYGTAFPAGEFIHRVPEDAEYDHSDFYTVYTQNNAYPIMIADYSENYIKSRYRNGVKVGGTHNGMNNGNNLLIYSVDTSIDLNVETKIPGSNTVKDNYTITYGERDVQYRVTPHITIASAAIKTELTRNGTQSTEITMVLTIPKYLTYNPASFYADYTHSDYPDGSLNWSATYEPGENGTTIVTFKTFVSDIDKILPELFYECHIGDETDPENDIMETGTTLVTYAEIRAKYSETNLMAAETHTDSATIKVLKVSQDGISETVKDHLLELGDDIEYVLTYGNSLPDATFGIQLFDVLPYNQDDRGTLFNGGYTIKSFTLDFTSAADRDKFISDGGYFALSDEDYAGTKPTDNNNVLNSYFEDDTIAKTVLTYEAVGEKSLRFDVSGLNRTVYAYDDEDQPVKKAPVIFAEIPRIIGEGRFNLTVTLGVRDPDDNTKLIQSGSGEGFSQTQTSSNEYHNVFIYRKRITGDTYFAPLVSNNVAAMVVSRSLSGIIWMDQDHDGLYDSPEYVAYNNSIQGAAQKAVEYPISGVRARLFIVNRGMDNLSPAVDVLGNPIQPVYSDENGFYQFTDVPAGNYSVILDDPENSYIYQNPDENVPDHPISFGSLSVTSTMNSQANRGNKFIADYDNGTELKYAELNTMVINMPEKSIMPVLNYVTPDWNAGLYYQDINIHKTWDNMIYGIPDETTIVFDITGEEQYTDNEVYSAQLTMTNHQDSTTNPDGDVKAYYTVEGQEPVEIGLTVTTDDTEHIVNWFVSENNRLFLPAENENGPIDYIVEETVIRHYGRDVAQFYVTSEREDIDEVTKKRVHVAVNSQILGSVTVTKESGSFEPVEDAEFTIYQVTESGTPDEIDYYGAKSGIGDTLTDDNKYQTVTTRMYNKVLLGDQSVLNLLIEKNMYNAETNILTITRGDNTEEAIVHKELRDETTYYYYNTLVNDSFSYEVILGNADDYDRLVNQEHIIDENDYYHYSNGKLYNVLRRRVNDERQYYIIVNVVPTEYQKIAIAEFADLPLYNLSGEPIYYTVRETKEPSGYISLANFKTLTGLDLYNGGKTNTHNFSFTVINNKQMKLPVSGGSGLSMTVLFGAILIFLGSAIIVLLLYRKKHGRLPLVLTGLKDK